MTENFSQRSSGTRTLLILLLLSARQHCLEGSDQEQQVASGDLEEFPALLQRVSATDRLHIVAEIVQNNQRIQIEEFVDLKTHNQLIQIKWHPTTEWRSSVDEKLKTRKLNLLILNEEFNNKTCSYLYEYEPYRCALYSFNGLDIPIGVNSWPNLLQLNKDDGTPFKQDDLLMNLIKSIRLTSLSSPYVSLVDRKETLASVMGISGLWLQATSIPGSLKRHPDKSNAWRLDWPTPRHLSVDYYLTSAVLPKYYGVAKTTQSDSLKSNAVYDLLNLVEIKDYKSDETLQLINVIDVDFHYSDNLARNLFSLPIGFDCPENPAITSLKKGVYLDSPIESNQVNEFELLATRYTKSPKIRVKTTDGGSNNNNNLPSTSVKNLEIARVRHPMDRSKRVLMYHLRGDREKFILDFHSQLEYYILFSGSSHQCSITQLCFQPNTCQLNETKAPEIDGRSSNNVVRLYFHNQITLALSEYFLDYLLRADSDSNKSTNWRLLNILSTTSSNKNEYIYEEKLPKEDSEKIRSHISMTDSDGQYLEDYRMSIVRVYEQKMIRHQTRRNTIGDTKKNGLTIKSNALALKRVILLIFDKRQETKLAELRLNLIRQVQTLDYAKRAELFDLSHCFNLERESMALSVYYPADFNLIKYIETQSNKGLIERFYGTMLDWQAPDNSIESEKDLKKRALGASFNWLRVPKVELLGHLGSASENDEDEPELELRLTVLDRISPLYQFQQIPQSTFEIDAPDMMFGDHELISLVIQTAEDCAQFCRHPIECRMFAWNKHSHICKLTHLLPKTDSLKLSSDNNDDNNNNNITTRVQPQAKLTLEAFSDVYYEPDYLRTPAYREASLADLYSYFEHQWTLDQLGPDNGDEDQEYDDNLVKSLRERRHAQLNRQRLLAFDFVDRSNLANEYSPPKLRLLEPSLVSLRRVPQTLDVSRSDSDLVRLQVARSFQSKQTGKCYKLTALDGQSPPQLIDNDGGKGSDLDKAQAPVDQITNSDDDERIFIDNTQKRYITLKRIKSIDEDQCALMCFNIKEWDGPSSSEQICEAFSYSSFGSICHLVIRTDFKFVHSVLDLTQDKVLEIKSLDELEVSGYDCYIVGRNYLSQYEGPIRLGANFYGRQTVPDLETMEKFDEASGLRFNWLATFSLESPVLEPHQVDGVSQLDECARRCSSRATGPLEDQFQSYCLAFDFVSTVELAEGAKKKVFKISCNLLLVDVSNDANPSRVAEKIRLVRNRLASIEVPRKKKGTSSAPLVEKKILSQDCSRYIVSHLHEFNHLAKRQLNLLEDQGKSSSEFHGKQLIALGDTSTQLNLDSCALECFLDGKQKCVLFQFCLVRKENSMIERQCTRYGVASKTKQVDTLHTEQADVSEIAPATKTTTTRASNSSTSSLTSYNDNCHVYLCKEFTSIEQVLKMDLSREPYINADFAHFSLSIWFSIIYVPVFVSVVAYVLLKRRDTSPGEQMQAIIGQINTRISSWSS